MLLIAWLADINIDWGATKLHWLMDKLQCIMGSCDRWEFLPFSKGHWQSLALTYQLQIILEVLLLHFTQGRCGQCRRPGIVIACVCLCVRLSMCVHVCVHVCITHELVCSITHHIFKLGTPNLDQRCKRPWLTSLLFCRQLTGVDFQGEISFKS